MDITRFKIKLLIFQCVAVHKSQVIYLFCLLLYGKNDCNYLKLCCFMA